MVLLFSVLACTGPVPVRTPPNTHLTPQPSSTQSATPPTNPQTTTTTTPQPPTSTTCERGDRCNPITISSFPFTDSQDTSLAADYSVDAYSCDNTINEGGGAFWYHIQVPDRGVLTASINELEGDDVDVDVHLLGSNNAQDCIERDHQSVSVFVEPGDYFLVLDTYVNAAGVAQEGPYTLTVTLSNNDCEFAPTDLRMRWSSCSLPSCFVSNSDTWVSLPATGPVVKEAHLVTNDDSFGSSWPNSFTDSINDHYAMSEAESGYLMSRSEPWAPAGEGGSEYGQGATGGKIPAADEAWYITMNWKDRPAGGTRMLVKNPSTGEVVVASAGYETGPGATTSLAGVTEEIHHYLGTSHLSDLQVGFARDGTLPLGPLDCP